MAYRLGPDLWCCHANDHLVFLDVVADRYFRLPAQQEHIVNAVLRGDRNAETDLQLPLNIAAGLRAQGKSEKEFTIPVAQHSLEDHEEVRTRIDFRLLVEIAIILSRVRYRLKTRPLKESLSASSSLLHKRRQRLADEPGVVDDHLAQIAHRFQRARRYVPIEPSCLLDSLALSLFLARRHFSAPVVLGITCDPFSAHCWVQVGETVLNDTLGSARSHTPIGTF